MPFISRVWEERVQSLQTPLGSPRASKDAGAIWLAGNSTTACKKIHLLISVPFQMTLLPVAPLFKMLLHSVLGN